MRDLELGHVARALRHRRGWRQTDVADQAGVSQREVSRLEAGAIDHFTLATLRRVCRAVGLDVSLDGRWRGGELARLLDADHAALQASVARLLAGLRWLVAVEATFSRYGERGSYDILAFHPGSGTLLVVEIKTIVADLQGVLRPLDVKARLAMTVARDRGWQPRGVVVCLVVADGSTARRRVSEHAPLFARFALRGGAARRWLREPSPRSLGLLLFRTLPGRPGRSVRRAGRQRVRVTRGDSSVEPDPAGVAASPDPVYQTSQV